jgi:DNA-binding protein YbaB
MPTTNDSADTNKDAEILKEIRDYLQLCISADDRNRDAALDDLEFVAGEQWDPRDRQQRALSGRPCLTINKLPTFLHQVTNDQRQNKMGAKIHPVGEEDKDKADIVQGIVRHIEYASNATVATGTAVNSAATIGFGFYRLITRYCDEKSFDQEIAFKRIRNAFTVYMDPGIQEPDGSDQLRCLLSEKMPKAEFKRLYPKASVTDASGLPWGTGDESFKDWMGEDFVRVAEFYKVELTTATLVMTEHGPMWEDEARDANAPIITGKDGKPMTRESARRKVMWRKTNGCEILDEAEIPCYWIPVFPVVGDEVDIDGKVIRSGLVRHAKDPAKMYNYWMTAATEEVALRPKSKYIGAEGQFEGHEDEWAAANTSSAPYLEYKPTILDGQLAPPPMRQPMADVPIGTVTMARSASDDIKATTGLFDSSLGLRGNATSGIQERAQQLQGDTANFHYQDNSQITYRHAIRCVVDMIPKVYDGARIVQIMGEDEKISSAAINGYLEDAVDITTGKYDVTISVGPAYSTARQEATDALIEIGKGWPELMQIAGDKVIASMDFHGSEEVAERIKRTIPPNILGDDEKDQDAPMVQTPRGPIPVEQAGQMLEQMNQQMQEMGAELQKAQAGIPKAQIDAQSKLELAQIEAASRERIAQINATAGQSKADTDYLKAMDVAELAGVVQLLVAKLQPPPQLAADAEVTGKASEATE